MFLIKNACISYKKFDASISFWLKRAGLFFHPLLSIGGLAIAVPGEVNGLYNLWRSYGKLKWSDLIEPSVKLARDGIPLPIPVYEAAVRSEKKIRNDPGLR